MNESMCVCVCVCLVLCCLVLIGLGGDSIQKSGSEKERSGETKS